MLRAQRSSTRGDLVIHGDDPFASLDEQAHAHLGLIGIEAAAPHDVIDDLGVVGRTERRRLPQQVLDILGCWQFTAQEGQDGVGIEGDYRDSSRRDSSARSSARISSRLAASLGIDPRRKATMSSGMGRTMA